MDFKATQPPKTCPSKVFNPAGKAIEDSFLQPENAEFPMLVTPLGIAIEESAVQP